MKPSVLRRLVGLFAKHNCHEAVSYALLRRLLAQRIAGENAPWLNHFLGSATPVLTQPPLPEVCAILNKLPNAREGSQDGLCPQDLALLNELFSSDKKAQGIFYTPWSTAVHLAEETLFPVLTHQAGLPTPTAQALVLGKKAPLTAQQAQQAERFLRGLTVCDPAAGAGGLLVPFALTLLALRKTLTPSLEEGQMLQEIVEQNLFAADISSAALDDLQLRFALLLAQKGQTPTGKVVLPHVFWGDALGEKSGSSVLCKAFAPVFEQKGGFDVILSNPPYVGQKNHRAVFEKLRQNPLWKDYCQPKSDLLYFFFYLTLDLLKEGGIGSFITTSYFASAAGAQSLRTRLKQETALLFLEDFGEERLFRRAAGQHSLITLFSKTNAPHRPPCRIGGQTVEQENLFEGKHHFLKTHLPPSPALEKALYKMAACKRTLQTAAQVSNGLMTGCDKISAAHLRKHPLKGVQKGEGVFVLSPREKEALVLTADEQQKLKPFFKNSDILPYVAGTKPSGWLIDFFYPNDRELDFALYPHLRAHLARFAPVLLARRQNNNGIDKQLARGVYWFGSVRRKMDFDGDKLAVPQRSARNTFAFAPGPWYASSDVYFISHPAEGVSLWYLLGLFNSAPYFAWLYLKGKRKGHLLELYSAPLNALPVPIARPDQQQRLERLAQMLYNAKKENPTANTSALQRQADQMVGDIFGFTPEEALAIQTIAPHATGPAKPRP